MPVKGRGVFPTQAIPAGELIIKFEGPVYDKATMAEEKDFSEAIQVRAGGAQRHGACAGLPPMRSAAAPRSPHPLPLHAPPPLPPTRAHCRWA